MTVQEAKDFLVEQATQQASLDGVSLSDLEKRMMYFTESADATEDPLKLNDEFQAHYDTAEYEVKVSRLLHHAFFRVKKENPETARRWNEAVKALNKGDHYILVLLDQKLSGERPPYDNLKLLGTALLLILVVGSLIALAEYYNFHIITGPTGPTTHKTSAAWVSRLFIAAMAAVYIYSLVRPWILKHLRRK
jgi:hypothetical protein